MEQGTGAPRGLGHQPLGDLPRALTGRMPRQPQVSFQPDRPFGRVEPEVADEAAKAGAGLVLMHSRGTPGELHGLPPVADIIEEVITSLRSSVEFAEQRGVRRESIVIDPGIGFGKTQEQNLELIAKLDQLIAAFPGFPLLIGTSRKSFIGRILADPNGNPAPVNERLHGSLATLVISVLKGAQIVRVHDVKAAVETIRVADAIRTS